ncbi:hypothetical protein MNBD_NITROSPINAE04-1031 [hydrothermal vent metagenome]|uniref:J domain-containing protein n=1 Tax=hydrothermal vent metagenome TaxID=652676 RepID=A0A3B1BTJ3_9ZZZZ
MIRKSVSWLNHYELLNLDTFASNEQIQRAYLNSVSIYSKDSIASYGAISGKERQWMINRIQEAYDILINPASRAEYDSEKLGLAGHERKGSKALPLHGAGMDIGSVDIGAGATAPPARHSELNNPAAQPSGRRITGANLRDIRRAKGASLDEISEVTKVKKSFLEAIEEQDVDNFPAPVFMRGYLKAYAKALALDPAEIMERYMAEE